MRPSMAPVKIERPKGRRSAASCSTVEQINNQSNEGLTIEPLKDIDAGCESKDRDVEKKDKSYIISAEIGLQGLTVDGKFLPTNG